MIALNARAMATPSKTAKILAAWSGLVPVAAGAVVGLAVLLGVGFGRDRADPAWVAPSVSLALTRLPTRKVSNTSSRESIDVSHAPTTREKRCLTPFLDGLTCADVAIQMHTNVPPPRTKPPAWVRHAARITVSAKQPRIALIIDDMGVDARRSALVVALDKALTLSYLPYAAGIVAQTAAARAAGHELLVHVPMESTVDDAHPGPKVLETGTPWREIEQRLRWSLRQFDGFVGINNHMGSRFTRDAGAMRVVMRELSRRGLLFVDSLTGTGSRAALVARSLLTPFAERDVFIDHEDDLDAIRARFADLERIARGRGTAVGIGHPRDNTIAVLRQWIPDARARGFAFVPVSAVARLLGPETPPVEESLASILE